MKGPHNTSPGRLRQIAKDLHSEGWYTWAGTLDQLADELETLIGVGVAAEHVCAEIGAIGQIDSRHPLTLDLLNALVTMGPPINRPAASPGDKS